MIPGHDRQPLIVTAADHRFARTLAQFLLSAERHGEHRRCRWAIYDLGLSDADRTRLRERFGWADIRSIQLADYPPHVAVASGSYAWKPVIIREAARDLVGPLFWFDSGTILRAPLDGALRSLANQGFWGLRSQMPLAQKCDPRVLDALEVPLEVRHLREYAAGAVGFDLATPLGRQLVEDWGHHALIADYIVPEGYAVFHKHDQALLNSLLAKAAYSECFEPTLDEIDISSPTPSRLVSTRNYVPPQIPLWADPAARAHRALHKAADRIYHRLRRFDDTRIDGWRRRYKEHFSVVVKDLASGRQATIPSPRGGYYADPFVWQRDGQTWVFVEEFVYAHDRGHLTVLALDADLAVTSAAPVTLLPRYAALDCHASFPFMFEHQDKIYMVPETHERRAVDLFVCERWPDSWRLVRRLLFDVDAVDSMVVQVGGLWHLITSTQGRWPNRHLEIYSAPDLLSGRFEAHPVNDQGIYGNTVFGTGRNAGCIARNADGTLMRLMQQSRDHYGEGLQATRIDELTALQFAETPALTIDCLPGIGQGFPSHHASRAGNVIAYDTRDRAK
jgi:hypothetical protein